MTWTLPGDFLIEFTAKREEETFEAGKNLACKLKRGTVVALTGELGSGKTFFTKGIAAGLGIKENVTSPTYTIISEYETQNSIIFYHIDLYRLESDEDFEEIGGREIINGDGITVIEWSDRLKNMLPEDAISVTIEITGNMTRLIKITGLD